MRRILFVSPYLLTTLFLAFLLIGSRVLLTKAQTQLQLENERAWLETQAEEEQTAEIERRIIPTDDPTLFPPYPLPFAIPETSSSDKRIFLPLLKRGSAITSAQSLDTRRINVPFFEGEVRKAETAIIWFGRVNREENFADVRVGYNNEILYVNVAVYDRNLWYNPSPAPEDLTHWDAVSLYLSPLAEGSQIGEKSFRFDAMLRWFESPENFRAAFRGEHGNWKLASVPFNTSGGWRGHAPNDNSKGDRGWDVNFEIPFSSLGLDGWPNEGVSWRFGVVVHDRDDLAAASNSPKHWPESFNSLNSDTWGELRFGHLNYIPPQTEKTGEVLIRHKREGAHVPGGGVGGGTICAQDIPFWTEWGDTSYPGSVDFNIQNQADVADWPCFARYYINFPLDAVPPGKTILSARLTLYQFGNSGGGHWGEPDSSYIQIYTVAEDWKEGTLTWNNAPLAMENITGAWVDPVTSFPDWPGVPWDWDVTYAVAQAYTAGDLLRLAIYTADTEYHSGKYFTSSYTADWNARGRPSLVIEWGDK
jgi:hypothetical protein